MPSFNLPLEVKRNNFGIGQDGVWLSSRSTARGDRISTPCPPSPPSDFWKLKVTTSSFCHGKSIAKQADVESAMVKPARSSGIQSPFGTLTPAAVPFQVKMTSLLKSTAFRSGNCPYGATCVTGSIFSWLTASVTQSLPKDSHAKSSTPRAPSIDHIAISTAPVSEPGTMPMR